MKAPVHWDAALAEDCSCEDNKYHPLVDDCQRCLWRTIRSIQRDALEAAANKVENFDPSHDEFEAHGELVDECAKQIRALMPKPEEDGTAPQSAVQGEG